MSFFTESLLELLPVLEPTALLCEPVLEEAPGVLAEELDDGLDDGLWLMSDVLLLGVLLEAAAPGAVLVEDCDCEDCEPQVELVDFELSGEVLEGEVALDELLVCGLLLALESGVAVLPAAPVVLPVLELLATLPLEVVCELADVSGVLD